MSVRSQQLPVRILKIWFDVVLALGVVAAVLFLVWLVVSPFVLLEAERPTEATIQVTLGEPAFLWFRTHPVELEDPGATSTGRSVEKASLFDMSGDLRLLTWNWRIHYGYLAGILVGTALVLWVIWMIRRVLIEVLADRPFAAINGRLFKRCGYVILLTGVLWPPYEFVLSRLTLAEMGSTSPPLHPAITFEKDVFVVGLLFLVFGIILRRGHEIQQHEEALEKDQALTI
jgi:hypothetical protein